MRTCVQDSTKKCPKALIKENSSVSEPVKVSSTFTKVAGSLGTESLSRRRVSVCRWQTRCELTEPAGETLPNTPYNNALRTTP